MPTLTLLAQTGFNAPNPTAPDLPWMMGMLLIAMVVIISLFWALTWLSRKPAPHVDPKRLRTHATLRLSRPLPADALVEAMRPELQALGITVGAGEQTPAALFVPMEARHAQFAVRVETQAEGAQVAVLHHGAANRPISESHQAPLDTPALRTLLDAVDRGLRKLPEGSEVRWHKHEKARAGDLGDGAHEPFARGD